MYVMVVEVGILVGCLTVGVKAVSDSVAWYRVSFPPTVLPCSTFIAEFKEELALFMNKIGRFSEMWELCLSILNRNPKIHITSVPFFTVLR